MCINFSSSSLEYIRIVHTPDKTGCTVCLPVQYIPCRWGSSTFRYSWKTPGQAGHASYRILVQVNAPSKNTLVSAGIQETETNHAGLRKKLKWFVEQTPVRYEDLIHKRIWLWICNNTAHTSSKITEQLNKTYQAVLNQCLLEQYRCHPSSCSSASMRGRPWGGVGTRHGRQLAAPRHLPKKIGAMIYQYINSKATHWRQSTFSGEGEGGGRGEENDQTIDKLNMKHYRCHFL